jgi:hypothetical protein
METAKKLSFSEIFHNILAFLTRPELMLLWVGFLVYGMFIPMLGIYWDDVGLTWYSDIYGNAGLSKYFSTERPFWGLFYQLNMSILGTKPWRWQAFGIFWRWACSVGLYFLIRQLWKESREPAFIAGLVYLLYPGFEQQYIANTYGHFFLVFTAYFFSVGLSLYALEHKKYRTLTIITAIILAAINLFCMEYYFMLELMRPIFFWLKLWHKDQKFLSTLKIVFRQWFPYFLVFLAAGMWRALSLKNLTYLSELNQRPMLSTQPLEGLIKILKAMGKDIWLTVVAAWGQVFQFSSIEEFGLKPWLFYLGVMIGMALLMLLIYRVFQKSGSDSEKNCKRNAWTFLILGFIALIPAGTPFWATGLNLSLDFPSDRFSLPFIMGSSMILISVLYLLPWKPWLRRAIFIVLIVLAGGYQVRLGFTYNTAWVLHERFVWQMVWRIPSIEPGTMLLSDEMPVNFYSDNSLSAVINLIYNPDPDDEVIDYIHYYPTVRKNLDLETKNQEIIHDMRIGVFQGNSDQSLTFYYKPPNCFRVIDAEIEGDNLMLSEVTRKASLLATTNPILASPQAVPPEYVYGTEPERTWCYYYEKADLARQQRDWETVVDLAETGFTLEPGANDPVELFPFIEGFAHQDDWQRSLALSDDAVAIDKQIRPTLCKLWERIAEETADGTARQEALESIKTQLSCQLP